MQGIQYKTPEKPNHARLRTGKFFIGGGGVELHNLRSLSDVPRVKESGRTKSRSCIMYGKERKCFMVEGKEDIARKTKA